MKIIFLMVLSSLPLSAMDGIAPMEMEQEVCCRQCGNQDWCDCWIQLANSSPTDHLGFNSLYFPEIVVESSDNSKDANAPHAQEKIIGKLFECKEGGCEYITFLSGYIAYHKAMHDEGCGQKCSREKCGYLSKNSDDMLWHELQHENGGRHPFSCDHPGCDIKKGFVGELKKHCLVHCGRVTVCSVEGCGYAMRDYRRIITHEREKHGK